jgi:peptidoglycan/xylan/chitin deacetylase (PgdA/CDA1 family)
LSIEVNYSANTLERGVRRSGFAWLVRKLVAKRRVSILAYHDPEPSLFAEHLEYLSARYSFVRMGEVADARRNECWDQLPDYPLVVTCDDGWRGNQELIDVCRRYECPITIYVCSQVVDTSRHYWWTETSQAEELKPLPVSERLDRLRESGFDPERDYPDRQSLDRSEAAAMIGTVDFGSHTRFHPILTVCSDDDAEREISESKREVEEFSGQPCEHFSYPNGDFTSREAGYAASAGYASARTSDIGWNGPRTDPYRLRILGVPDRASVDQLAAHLAGIDFLWRWRLTRRWNGQHPTITLAGSNGTEA